MGVFGKHPLDKVMGAGILFEEVPKRAPAGPAPKQDEDCQQ